MEIMIEDITMEEITGITQTYGKWSLSGTHLLIVLVITASETATLSNSQLIANINLPDWIKEKITPVWSTVILYTQNTFRDDSWGSVSCNFTLRKESALEIRSSTNFTNSSTEKICRIAFDLLIDNE